MKGYKGGNGTLDEELAALDRVTGQSERLLATHAGRYEMKCVGERRARRKRIGKHEESTIEVPRGDLLEDT